MPSNDDVILRQLMEGLSDSVGRDFFRALTKTLARALGVSGAMVTEFDRERRTSKAIAFWSKEDGWIEDYQYSIANTPCEAVFEEKQLYHYPDHLQELFPVDHDLPNMGYISYMGVPLLETDGTVLGNLAILDRKPMPAEPRHIAIFRLFATRAAAEHQRLKMDAEIREREHKLARLFDSAMDAIIEFTPDLTITQFNRAAENTFGCSSRHTLGGSFGDLLESGSATSFQRLVTDLSELEGPGSAVWGPGRLDAKRGDGTAFAAEATVSKLDTRGSQYFTVVLRSIEDRIRSSGQIHQLKEEAKSLRNEIDQLRGTGELIGRSKVFREVLQTVDRVAPTEATVLIGGETGTGKEVIARAIHASSRRGDHHLVCVNCAAIPPNLIESEFFGHEKGAFTGATEKREGRFARADGGTLFLDEVGELPLELQGKLLRVLQEGAFEPVGSSKTRQVNVRLIAATNRDLEQEIAEGRFRQDLFYRLNVFPLSLPALRERGNDVLLLAESFAQKISQTMGRPFAGLTESCREILLAHPWPGNIRELHNVIERSLITSTDGHLDLPNALKAGTSPHALRCALQGEGENKESIRILTENQMRDLERGNIIQALKACRGKVSGDEGAAKLLAIRPSTLNSRIKALGIEKTR